MAIRHSQIWQEGMHSLMGQRRFCEIFNLPAKSSRVIAFIDTSSWLMSGGAKFVLKLVKASRSQQVRVWTVGMNPSLDYCCGNAILKPGSHYVQNYNAKASGTTIKDETPPANLHNTSHVPNLHLTFIIINLLLQHSLVSSVKLVYTDVSTLMPFIGSPVLLQPLQGRRIFIHYNHIPSMRYILAQQQHASEPEGVAVTVSPIEDTLEGFDRLVQLIIDMYNRYLTELADERWCHMCAECEKYDLMSATEKEQYRPIVEQHRARNKEAQNDKATDKQRRRLTQHFGQSALTSNLFCRSFRLMPR